MPQWIPEGWHTITPRLVAQDPAKLVEFLKRAFGATGEYTGEAPSQLKIGDSLLMVSGVGPRQATSAFFYLYVEDIDAVYQRALQAGATSIEAPMNTPYGDRRAMLRDPSGNDWQIATVPRRILERSIP